MFQPPSKPPDPTFDKASLKLELERSLAADLAAREQSHRAAKEAATHEEARPENDKDTRALEQSYLARGEAMRVEELRTAYAEVRALPVRSLDADDPVGLGALVVTEEAGVPARVWIAPHGGGIRLAGGQVHVVTPKSPLGRALLGKRRGEECDLVLAGKTRVLTVVSVQ